MKKIVLLIALMATTLLSNAQVFGHPANPAPNFTICGGPYLNFNLVEYAEPGVMVGVNMKDIFMVGPFYQYGIKNNNHLYGMYTHINFFPKEYYISLGFGARWGTYDFNQLTVEPMMVIQVNGRNSDKWRHTHNIGFVGGWPSYTFGIVFGNFGEKWWNNPSYDYISPYRAENSMYRKF